MIDGRLRWLFVLLAVGIVSCARRDERAPASCPPAPAPVDLGGRILTIRPASDVFVSRGLGYDEVAGTYWVRPQDPKPGATLVVVRLSCIVHGQPMQDKRYACEPATRTTSIAGAMFDARAHECFKIRERAATPEEAAAITIALNARKPVEVEGGTIYAMDMKHVPWESGAAPYPEIEFEAYARDRLLVNVPYYSSRLDWIDISPPPSPREDLPPAVRLAMRFDDAVRALHSIVPGKFRSALELLESDLQRFRPNHDLGEVGRVINDSLPTLQALARGDATVHDACKLARP